MLSSSEANLLPGNNLLAIEDVYNNIDKVADTNAEILIPAKKNINGNDIFKKSM